MFSDLSLNLWGLWHIGDFSDTTISSSSELLLSENVGGVIWSAHLCVTSLDLKY